MCGLVGICYTDTDRTVSEPDIRRMSDSIRHRGPDGEGIFTDNNIGLGHRRLSIIDLTNGHQPMLNRARSLAIVFNGEIYNYKELRDELRSVGYKFETESDTEVIIHLYDRFGESCVEHLNGMFAFAIWDASKRQVFAARDRMGEKPFYFLSKQNGDLVFASELKSIRVLDPNLVSDIDSSAVDDFLSYGYVPSPKTIYKNVRKLSAAHTLTWKDGSIFVRRYWTPHNCERAPTNNRQDTVDELEALIYDSIRLRLRSDVPVGAFLSGGIDSSLIVAIAAEISDQPLNTFSVGFSESEFDESIFAKVVADQFSTHHHRIHVENIGLDIFPDLVRQFDEPFADPSAIPTYYVTRSAADQLKVCLSGDAGDELFCGYSQYRREPFERPLDFLPDPIRRSAFGGLARLLPDDFRGKGRLQRIAASGAVRHQRMVGVFDSDERLRLLSNDKSQVDLDATQFAPFFDNSRNEIDSRVRCDQSNYLCDDILVKVDRDSMLNSLEVRVPLLDHRIVEFANSVSLGTHIEGGVQKSLLKQLLKSRVAPEILTRKKQGFSMPIRDWIRGDYKDFCGDLLLAQGNRIHDFIDKKGIQDFYDAHMKARRDLSDRIWTLMCFEQWCREFGV